MLKDKFKTFIKNIKKKYPQTIIIPIGRGCHTAMHLNNLGLRNFSYPMDWVLPDYQNEVLETRFYLLVNGFKNFFNESDLILYHWQNENSLHASYRNKRTGLTFHHDFEKAKDFKSEYKKIKKKYTKRAKRCINHIKNAKNIYLIYMTNTWDHMDEVKAATPDNMWKLLMERIKITYKSKNIQLIIFEHDPQAQKFNYKKTKITNNITKYTSNHTYTKNNEKLGTILTIEKVLKDEYPELFDIVPQGKMLNKIIAHKNFQL